MENILSTLNDSQKIAVQTTQGPLLVLSGAGTGKTKVLTSRIAYILNQNLCQPWEILALTFTNKASGEMKNRLAEIIGDNATLIWAGTFHSICIKILRSCSDALGYTKDLVIFDESDQKLLIKRILKDLNYDLKENPASEIVNQISKLKDKLIYPDSLNFKFMTKNHNINFQKIYTIYQNKLKELNAMDFGDLIALTIKLFQENINIAEKYQERFKYILIDEYQDTNKAQYELLKILSQKYKNICAVGDDDQSIYSWRGAEIKNILDFEKDFPNAKIIKLQINYRSTKHILLCASTLISNNKNRHEKKLIPYKEMDANKIELHSFSNDESEAYWVAQTILNLKNKCHSLNEIAILLRTSALTRIFEDRFLKSGIPYKIIGGLKFYERAEIKDMICYLRLITNEKDNIAFERILNTPKRGLGDAVLFKLNSSANILNKSLLETTQILTEQNAFSKKQNDELKTFYEMITFYKTSQLSASELVKDLMERSGYLKALKEDKKPESPARQENLKELVNVLKFKFDNISEFLEYVSLISDWDDSPTTDTVSIMTMHASKGLEFETVFLPCWEEGIFPNDRALKEESEMGLEEERRLAYVSITRAKRNCMISYASTRFTYGQINHNFASIFLTCLPKENISLFSHKDNVKKTFSYFKSQKILQKPGKTSNIQGREIIHPEYGNGKILLSNKTVITVLFDSNIIKNLMLHEIKFKN